MQHFNPEPRQTHFSNYATNQNKIDGTKSAFEATLLTSQICFTRCNVQLTEDSLSQGETDCIRKCSIKFNDSSLLVENELANFTRGIAM